MDILSIIIFYFTALNFIFLYIFRNSKYSKILKITFFIFLFAFIICFSIWGIMRNQNPPDWY